MDDQLEHRTWVRPMVDELEREIRKARETSWARVRALEWDDLKFGDRDHFPHQWPHYKKLITILEELSSAASDLCVDDETAQEFDKGNWSLASEFVALKSRKIHRGFLTPVVEISVPLPVSVHLFALIKIDGDRNHLIRENHNFGIHYHYELADKRRTTTLICWDTRWLSPDKSDPNGKKGRPLFHQLHNDSSNGVSATPDRWGPKKRKSVRAAC